MSNLPRSASPSLSFCQGPSGKVHVTSSRRQISPQINTMNCQISPCLPIKIQRDVAFTRRTTGPKQILSSTCETKALPHRPCKMAETGTLRQRPSPPTYFTATATLRNVNIHTCSGGNKVAARFNRMNLLYYCQSSIFNFNTLKGTRPYWAFRCKEQ